MSASCQRSARTNTTIAETLGDKWDSSKHRASRSALGNEEGSPPHRGGSRPRVHSCPLATTIEALYMHGLRERHEEGKSVGTIICGCWSPAHPSLRQAHPVGRRDLPERGWQFGQRPDHAENGPGMPSRSPSIDKKWEHRKRDMNWTISSLTHAVHEAKKKTISLAASSRVFGSPRGTMKLACTSRKRLRQ